MTREKVYSFSQRLQNLTDHLIPIGCFCLIILVYFRAFLGTEITDEAYYIADTLGNLRGNCAYALNNYFAGIGYTFLPTPFFFVYLLFVPNGEGIVLFSRICFVTFKLFFYFCTYLILSRHVKPAHALLFVACSFSFSGLIPNFNYNSVPPVTMTLSAALAYDSIEGKDCPKKLAIFASGVMSGMTVFANPVYFAAIILHFFLILVRSGKGKVVRNAIFFVLGGMAAVLLVFVPLLFQAGIQKLWSGFSSMLKNIFSVEYLSELSLIDKLRTFFHLIMNSLLFVPLCLLVWILPKLTPLKRHVKCDMISCILLLVSFFVCVILLIQLYFRNGWNSLYIVGKYSFVLVFLVLLFGVTKNFPLFLYLGLFPLVAAVLTVFGSSSTAVLSRFQLLLYSLHAIILLLMECKRPAVRSIAVLSAALCILLQGYTLFKVPYRDGSLHTLTTKVESGVYKGLYTTPRRAHDLPELEEYLNTIVSGDEYYAFRDNVPCGYLMMHKGKICDVSSWDCLQYTYRRDTPQKLFDYYKRREAIPDVILYIDYGRDPELSIDNKDFRFNDFVHKYYQRESEVSLNRTFSRIVVYRYSGGFDGNYDSWINAYNSIP